MISILMPIYNGIEFIAESVGSVRRQRFRDWELLIAVNGHPENSAVYRTAAAYGVDGDRAIRVFDRHDLRGKANTLNAMLPEARYDWIALLDVDDIWHRAKLKAQLPHMRDYDVIGTHGRYFGRSGALGRLHAWGCDAIGTHGKYFGVRTERRSPRIPVGNLAGFDFLQCNPVLNSSCLVRKELCHWRPEIDGVEDYDLWLRLARQGRRFFNVPRKLLRHRIHAQSVFNTNNDSMVDALRAEHRRAWREGDV